MVIQRKTVPVPGANKVAQAAQSPEQTQARQQARLQYLQKNRPNDPQVKQLQGQGISAPVPTNKGGNVPNTSRGHKRINHQIKKTNFQDPNQVGNLQSDANREVYQENIVGNNPNEDTPFGSSRTTFDPVTGQPTVKTELTGKNKDLFDAETGGELDADKMAHDLLNGGFDINSVNGDHPIPTDTMADRGKYQDAAYGELTHGLDDQYGKDKEALAQNLADRGVPIGSAAYVAQQKQLDDRYDQTKLSARNQAYQAGGQEQEQSFGRQLQGHQTATGDYVAGKADPAAIASGLLGAGQGYQGPGTKGFQPVQEQGQDFSSLFQTAVQKALEQQSLGLKNKALNLAKSQAGATPPPGTD